MSAHRTPDAITATAQYQEVQDLERPPFEATLVFVNLPVGGALFGVSAAPA